MAQTVYRQYVTCLDTNTSEYFTHDTMNTNIYSTCPGQIPYHTWQNTINAGSISQNEVYVKNVVTGTQGIWRCDGEKYDVAAGPDVDFVLIGTKTFEDPVRLGCCNVLVDTTNSGDYVCGEILFPTSYTGHITEAVSSGNTIKVESKALARLKKGMTVELIEGATTQLLGKVTAIDTQTLTVTVTNTITESFTTAAWVQVEYMFVNNVKLVSHVPYILGATINGSIYLPAGSILEIYYKNMTASAKTLEYYVEYFA